MCHRNDIAQACKAGGAEGLRGIFPQAIAVAPRFFGMASNDEPDCSLVLIPKVLTAMHHGLPELTDCDHEFWQEAKVVNRMLQVDTVYGPCAREPGNTYAPDGTPNPLSQGSVYEVHQMPIGVMQ